MAPETLAYYGNQLHMEGVNLLEIADRYGTPLYVYSLAAIQNAYRSYASSLSEHPNLICYSVKANGNLALLNVLARLGSGFDIVSQGELARVLAAGGDPQKVVYSGVGKQEEEIFYALEKGILCFNIESEAEFDLLAKITRQKQLKARVSIRLNPDVDPHTHPYISTGLKENKFGLDRKIAKQLYVRMQDTPYLEALGVACHIGSQITELGPFEETIERMLDFVDELDRDGIELSHLDIGGGLGFPYQHETPPSIEEYVRAIIKCLGGRPLKLLVEPGRSLVAGAGILLTKILMLKNTSEKKFAIVDGGMNDLLRPALYGAWHPILPVTQREGRMETYDIVGPLCETGDFLGQRRRLCLAPGDFLAAGASGAYGFVLSSNYNARPRAAEVMVSKKSTFLIRKRETVEDLWRGEDLLPDTFPF